MEFLFCKFAMGLFGVLGVYFGNEEKFLLMAASFGFTVGFSLEMLARIPK